MKKVGIAILAIAMLAGCSSESNKTAETEKPQPKAPELVTGRTAFQKMFIAARSWQRDAQPYRLESQYNSDSKGHDGKSAIWRAWFASPATRAAKPFSWSGTDASDAPARGVSPGTQDTYSPNNTSTQIFDVQFLKVDSDKALEVAQKHGGDKQLEKNPDLNVFFLLDWSGATNELVWHVIYGDNRDQAKLKVAVNASTGDFLRVEK
jgi:hypothetical protein